ncbi:hypothetical protein PAMP_001066 [Pampus punctatissimus]
MNRAHIQAFLESGKKFGHGGRIGGCRQDLALPHLPTGEGALVEVVTSGLWYLEILCKVIQGSLTKKELKSITVLHLCSAHILKVVSASFSRKINDKGLREFANHCVAHLVNSSKLDSAVSIFVHMGRIFELKFYSQETTKSLEVIKACIKSKSNLDDNSTQAIKSQTEPPQRDKAVLANSPFLHFFFRDLQL